MPSEKKEKVLFLLMRHGSTENNVDNNYRGWSNSKNAQLSVKGREEVRQTALWLKRSVPDISFILADDLDRTKETARIVADVLDLTPDQIDFDKRLRPINVGDFTGKSKDEHPLTEYLKNKSKVIPGGESLGTFNRRQSKVFADIVETVEKVDGTVLVIGHGSNISYLHNHFNKKEGEIGYEGAVNPAGVISFSKSGVTPLKNIRTGSEGKATESKKPVPVESSSSDAPANTVIVVDRRHDYEDTYFQKDMSVLQNSDFPSAFQFPIPEGLFKPCDTCINAPAYWQKVLDAEELNAINLAYPLGTA